MEPPKTLNAAIEAITQRMLRNLFTMLPVEILEYDSAFQLATVRPMMKFPYVNGVGDIRYVEPPPIQLVPVAIPGSVASRQTVKLAEGDFGLYIVSTFSINELLQTDPDLSEPKDPRTHGLMDGFVLPIDWFLSPKTGAALTADRHIGGTNIRIGDADTAFFLAKLESVQSAIDVLAGKINGIATAAAAHGVTIPPLLFLDTAADGTASAAAPDVIGTTNLRAS